jgi:MerR family transcriptional regulator, redox-sensitive transcriptional activator SoxR
MTIGEVAKRAGLRASAVRYYEDVGILPPAARISGQRRYDETVLARLAVIRLAQEVGFSVAEIRALVDGSDTAGVASERWQEMARHKMADVDALLRRAERMRRLLEASLACGCLTLDTCQLVLETRSSPQHPEPVKHPRTG